jgi:hypothetical protein
MTMPNDSELKRWADKLDQLLQKAAVARASEDPAAIVAAQKELRKFKEESPDCADALDTQATLAIFDLDLSATEEAVTAIQGRATEVYRLTKLIAGVSEEAGARVLTGALAIQAIDSATAAISSFRQLRDELSSSKAKDEKAIAAEIEQVLIAIQNLRNKLENP